MSVAAVVGWSAAGVVGVGLTAGALLWHVWRLVPQRTDPGMSLAWLLVAAGAVLGAPTHPEGPQGVGGALVVAGLVALGTGIVHIIAVPGKHLLEFGLLLGRAAAARPEAGRGHRAGGDRCDGGR